VLPGKPGICADAVVIDRRRTAKPTAIARIRDTGDSLEKVPQSDWTLPIATGAGQAAIASGRPLIARFSRRVETTPIRWYGLAQEGTDGGAVTPLRPRLLAHRRHAGDPARS
jgi:hypothetical protein